PIFLPKQSVHFDVRLLQPFGELSRERALARTRASHHVHAVERANIVDDQTDISDWRLKRIGNTGSGFAASHVAMHSRVKCENAVRAKEAAPGRSATGTPVPRCLYRVC